MIFSLVPTTTQSGIDTTYGAEGHAFIYTTRANCDCSSSSNQIFTIPNAPLLDLFPSILGEDTSPQIVVTNNVSYYYHQASYGAS